MPQTAKFVRIGLALVLLFIMLVPPVQAQAPGKPDSVQNNQDLFLLGFGELVLHSLSVTGNSTAFEKANPTLSDGFSSNYRASLFANGNAFGNFNVNGAAVVDSRIADEYRTFDPSIFRLRMSVESTEPIWDSWRFTGHGLYDPSRQWELGNLDTRLLTQPQEPTRTEIMARFESDEHGLIEGGSIRPSFKNSKLTIRNRSIFGGYADLHSGRVGAEAVAGKLEGKSFRQGSSIGFRADGTSGPYQLELANLTRGSEEIKIEVRDRYDSSTVLETRTLRRDVDYNIDYLRGRVVFHQPIASETIASDPVFIVISFDYIREDNDNIYGGRAKVNPVDEITVSGSYLHRQQGTNVDPADTGVSEPENLIAGDINIKLNDNTSGYLEVAESEDPNSANKYNALRIGAKSEIVEGLTLDASFQKIDDKFNSFTNSDLDPTKNQQRLQLGGKFELSKDQTITASFANNRGLEANGKFNSYAGLKNENIYSVGYKNQLIDQFGFGVRVERREVNDRQNALNEETNRNRGILDINGKFEDFFLFGDLGYKASYEIDMFRNEINVGEADSDKNQVTVSLVSKPNENTQLELGLRFSIRKDIRVDSISNFDDRQDASFAKLQYRITDNMNTYTTWEYQRYTIPGSSVQFWQDNPLRANWAGSFALEYLPLDRYKFTVKTGRREAKMWIDTTGREMGSIVTNDFLLGQLTYFHTHHLSFNLESEYTLIEKEYSENSTEKTWDLGLRINWNRDRLNEFTAGLIRHYSLKDDLTSTPYIYLLSGSISVTNNLFIRASMKHILIGDPIDDSKSMKKNFTRLEAGLDSNSWYRVSLGYERIEDDNESDPASNYTGQGFFVRLSGKL